MLGLLDSLPSQLLYTEGDIFFITTTSTVLKNVRGIQPFI